MSAVGKQRQQVYAECHVFRHWWQPTTVTVDGQFYIQHMVCLRCTMERRWKVSSTGDPVSNSYTAPPDYYQKSGGGQQARKELRLSEIERSRSSRKIRRVG